MSSSNREIVNLQLDDNTCTYCETVFSSIKRMKFHMSVVHESTQSKPEPKTHVCKKCTKSFIHIGPLINHVKAVHDVEKPAE